MVSKSFPVTRLARLARRGPAAAWFRLKSLVTKRHRLEQQVEELTGQVRTLGQAVETLNLRERQLRAIARADARSERESGSLSKILMSPAIQAHVADALARSQLHLEPFPYCVVDDIFPTAFYEALVKGLPPADLFADRPANKQHMVVPFEIGPAYSRRVWDFMAYTAAPRIIAPAVIDKFRAPITGWLRQNFPMLPGEPLEAIELSCSDGRILLRTRGYRIPPHRDPKWGFITCLLYLAKPGDDERWGTQLFAVDQDAEAPGAKPHWIDASQCRLIEEVRFRPNRALIFLNSSGAHGAEIPMDAPADLQRYAYQFRVGPDRDAITALLAALPPDRRAFWAGKAAIGY